VGKLVVLNPATILEPNLRSAFLSVKNPGLGRFEATAAGWLQVCPPSADLTNLMLRLPVLSSSNSA